MLVMLKAAMAYLALNLALLFGWLPTQPAAANAPTVQCASVKAKPAATRSRVAPSSPEQAHLVRAAMKRHVDRQDLSDLAQLDAMKLRRDLQRRVWRELALNQRDMAGAERAVRHARLLVAGFHPERLEAPSAPLLPAIPGQPTEATSLP